MTQNPTPAEAQAWLADPAALKYLRKIDVKPRLPGTRQLDEIPEERLLDHIRYAHLAHRASVAAYDIELATILGYDLTLAADTAVAFLADPIELPRRSWDDLPSDDYAQRLVKNLRYMELCGTEVDWTLVGDVYPEYEAVELHIVTDVVYGSYIESELVRRADAKA